MDSPVGGIIVLAWLVLPLLGPALALALVARVNDARQARERPKLPFAVALLAVLAAGVAGAALAFGTCVAAITVG